MMPTTKSSSRPRSRSLCEKSAAIAVNIVRASSLVLAKMALGPPPSSSAAPPAITHPRNSSHNIPPAEASVPPPAAAADHQKEARSTVAAAATAPMSQPAKSYVKEPDVMAEEYIRKVRERHFSDPTASSADLAKCIPPPPPPAAAVRKWSAHAFGR